MSFKLIANTVGMAAGQLKVTDSSLGAVTDIDGLANLRGGPRHLYYTQSGTADRYFSYIDTNGGLNADHMILVNADRHNGHNLAVAYYDTWAGGGGFLYQTDTFAATLVGIQSTDFVLSLGSVLNKDAFQLRLHAGTGGAYTKTLNQLYFGQSINFDHAEGLTLRRIAYDDPPIKFEGHYWHLYGVADIVLTNVSGSTLSSYWALDKRDALFLYEADGNHIPHKLWHCLILQEDVVQVQDDFYAISLTLGILRHW